MEPLGFCLQERYAAHSTCFGCGPANPKGLKVRSLPTGQSGSDPVVADWKASDFHEAFPGMLNGGIIGSLLDCHSNWTAAWHLMNRLKLETPPCTVTANYSVQLKRPTPSKGTIHLESWVVSATDDRAEIEATLTVDGKVCATCKGLFVAVKPGHPAYHRW